MPYSQTQIEELRTKRRALGDEMRKLHEGAREQKRDLTADEREKFDKMFADGESLRDQIDREEKLAGFAEAPSKRSTAVDPNSEPTPKVEPEHKPEARKAGSPRDSEEYRELFASYIGAPSQAAALGIAQRAHQYRLEHRDLSVDSDTQAGYLVPPEQFVMELLKDLDNAVKIRSFARTFQVRQAKSLGVPKRTAAASTWAWGSEIAAPTADTGLAYGKRELHPKNASGLIKVSRDFLRSALMSGEGIVRQELSIDGGELLENGFMTGSGAGQPLGLFTASDDGIPTSRDMATGNAATAITVEGLRNAKYHIKQPHWPNLRWLGSRDFHKQIYALSDGIGRPLFVESLKAGEPDRVMGFPLEVSEFAPATFTTGLYVGILGDFRYYWIVDALDMELQRLDELYAANNQVGFIGRLKVDAAPVLAEAFARVKLG